MELIESFMVVNLVGYFQHEHFHFMPGLDGHAVCVDVVWAGGRVVLVDWYDMRGRRGHADLSS